MSTVSHLDEEVDYIWTKRWTVGKAAYLLTRYFGAGYLILVSMSTIHLGWDSSPVQAIAMQEQGIAGFFLPSCLYGQIQSGLGPMILTLAKGDIPILDFFATMQVYIASFPTVILMMRVYALYEGAKKMLVAFVILTLLLFGFDLYQFLFFLGVVKIGSEPGNFAWAKVDGGCLAAPSSAGIAWTVTSSVELVLFLLVLWKIVKAKMAKRASFVLGDGRPSTQDMTALMARDSISYFAIIFSICLVGAISEFLTNRHIIKDQNLLLFLSYILHAYLPFVITIMTILTTKMLINLRAEYYGPSRILATELSWDVDSSENYSLQFASREM
ncbi:uncharacterized protein FOMMEDRAFT_151036 [Fomitiporia mediterranea MF3/22]|uniref:uncharacterized protein n=1 Tax=Fomitiporia mediterranea (strain MF3/22) TaxID=694068 RepID=UPI0004407A0C|nr:uncharacterized protein FOMMEDRAFT_151036 [Fomitiporia mediterranea MF3/22]EJD08282.1 hypothetical protein FOMMEDRAFT_151036 [Fomitiporia mediterranea MF3/22]